MTEKRIVKIRGKNVTFSSRKLKSGEMAYYRGGKRVSSSYQKRLARGVLSGLSVAEARGHPFGKYSGKQLSRRDIREQEEFHIGEWAEPPTRSKRGQEKASYYVKVSVKSVENPRAGSPNGDGEACVPMTMQLRNPDKNTQEGFTYPELTKNFERIVLFTTMKYGRELCTDNLAEDLIAVWRHSRR